MVCGHVLSCIKMKHFVYSPALVLITLWNLFGELTSALHLHTYIVCCYLMIYVRNCYIAIIVQKHTILHVSSLTKLGDQPNNSLHPLLNLYPFIHIRLAACFCVHVTQSVANFITISSLRVQKLNSPPLRLLAHGH